MKQVVKRDGKEVKFNLKKIVSAIRRAGESSGEFGYDEALDLTNSVIQMFDNKEKATVEEIQDAVEKVLNENNYTKTARAFIVYREKHNDMRKDNNVMIDAVQSIDDYLDRSDWRVNANANQGYSLGGMILNTSGKVTANYWLSHVYPKEAGEAHRNGDIQIHDLDMLANYCTGWSLRALLQEGFNGVKGKVESKPPKHLASALGQMVNFWGCLQNENAGAQAFSSFDTYLAPYVRNDKLTYKQVYDAIQEFVFNVNVPSRWGCVPNTTKVLSIDGWKSIDELSEDDVIYTWKNGSLNTCKVNGVCRKKFKGSLISFINTQYGYEQTVTPTHRTLVSKTNKNVFDAEIVHAEEIESDVSNKYWKFPTEFKAVDINTKANFSNDEITLAAMIYTDGNLDFRKENVHKVRYLKSEKRLQCLKESGIDPELIFNNLGLSFTKTEKVSKDFGSKMHVWNFYGDSAKKIVNLVKSKYEINKEFYKLNKCQADLFLHVWELHDGDESRHLLQVDNELIFEQLAHIAVLSGHVVSKKLKKCKSGKYVTYVSLTGVNGVSPKQISRINYDDMVWCPNVADGTAIFMNKDGGVFISGQTQTPFTNITLDWTCPEDLKDSQPIIAGEEMDYTYSELQPEMDMINKAFIEVMIKGDAHGRLFTFPIPTYNITPDFPWESENTKLLFEMTAKYGLPYFQNFLNSDLKVGDVRSMCCRLQLDLREIKKRGGGLFGSGEQTGSIGVITINCARLGYLFKNDITGLYKRLDELMNIARNALEQKRKSLNKWMEQGLYPYSKRYLGGYNTLFSTIGINGVNEMIRNFTNDEHDITDDYGQKFAMSLMDHINEVLKQFQVETGNLYNLEATPGEGTTFRFAKEDKKRYPEIIQAGKPEAPYYTNSTQIPVGYTNDPFTALNLQEGLQRRYSGGCVEAGNYVITNEGTILIEDIVKNFDKDNPLYVASFNKDTNTTEWDKVIDAVEIDVSKKDKINIKGEGNFNITTSDWHPFFVLQEDGSVVEKRADELKKNDKMITSNCCLFDDNERELTEEQAYLIGYFIGDGSLTKRIDNRGGNHLERYMVRFFDEKEEVLEKVRNIIKSNKFGDVNIIQTDKRSKKLKEVHCNSKSCADFFLKYGFHAGSKTYTVNIPDEVKCQLNKKNAYALLSGLIDSDSHVDSDGDVEYMTASVQLGYDIVWLCTMLGLSVSKTFKIDPRWPSTKLSRINIWHNSLLDIVEKLNTVKKICINQQKRSHSKLARKFNFVRVKETSKVDVEDNIFYDLTTENNHNYLCGKERFVFIHNTVVHLYMGEAMSSSDSCKTLVKRVLENYHIPYLTITPTFSICPKHGYISGEHKYCPICDEELTSPKQEQCKACKD